MGIAFKARVDDPAIASFRYRVLTPIAQLNARGHAAELFDQARADGYLTVVFSKAYREPDQALARDLRAQGTRVVLDLCDNHFYNPARLPKYEEARRDLLAMIGLCDRVVCSTPALAAMVREAAGLDETPAVAPDAYEQAPVGLDPVRPLDQPARLLWFGRHGSPNAPAGMEDLLRVAGPLGEALAARPFELAVCSDSREKFDRVAEALPVPCRYVEWTPASFAAELRATDGVLIPLSPNPFVAAKTHNRLSLALSAGAPVVADTIDSYREFAPFCTLDDWRAGLEEMLLRPEAARARAAPARAYLEANWSPARVGLCWEAALGLSEPAGQARPEPLPPPAPAPASARTQPRTPVMTSIEAAAWLQSEGRNQRAWLLAGDQADPRMVNQAWQEKFLILSLGRAFTRFGVDLAYVPDVETFAEAGEKLLENARVVLAPLDLHHGRWPTGRDLISWSADLPALRTLMEEGRLVAFPLWTGSPDGVKGDFDGEEVPLRLLAQAGVAMARHLGARSPRGSTAGFEAAHSIASRRSGGVARLRRESGISYGPYGFPVPARVFVGSDDEQLMGVRLLEYSIQKYSTMDVVVETLDWRRMPVPKDPKNRSRTGFSFCRFDIPRLCGFEGRGLYVDADMQVFTDITDLWTLPMEDADILYALSHPAQGRTPQTSVMLLNCAALHWDVDEIIGGLDEGRYSYKELMQKLCITPPERVRADLPYWWNSLERYEPGRTSLIHYTDMPTQPWVSHDNPNGELWYRTFAEALETGFISEAEVREAISKGHVSPELPAWIGAAAAADPETEKAAAVWVAPYHRFARSTAEVEGAVTLTSDRRLTGWAFRPDDPGRPVRLQVQDGDRTLMEFDAEEYVEILARHGKGEGRHAFDVPLPEEIWRSNVQSLSVRAVDPQAELPGSPVQLLR